MLKERAIICVSIESGLPLVENKDNIIQTKSTTQLCEVRKFKTLEEATNFCKLFKTFKPVIAEFEMFIEKIL